MNENEKICQIALTLLKGVGPANAKHLVNCLGSAKNLFTYTKQDLIGVSGLQSKFISNLIDQFSTVLRIAEKEYHLCLKKNITPIFYTDSTYPKQLLECSDAPLLLFKKGNGNLSEGKFLSIVGTRKATEYGKEQCFKLVSDLAKVIPDLIVVSGLAYGIDIAAHKAALQCNVPTIGVMAGGLNRIYPAVHQPIAKQMEQSGCIVTEQLYYDEPVRHNFLKRNRIIAGLCDALVVVESAAKGGALVTASIAGTYNKDVFVFPGRCNDIASAGCNALVKHHKAALIENASDFLYFMDWEKDKIPLLSSAQNSLPSFFTELSSTDQTIVKCIWEEKMIHIDRLSHKTHIEVRELLPMLIVLEFQNIVVCLPGNRYKLK